MNIVKQYFVKAPATWGLVALVWGIFLAAGPASERLRDDVGLHPTAPRLHAFITSGLSAPTWGGAILATVALATLGVIAERRLGTVLYGAYALAMHLGGVMGGSALQLAISRTDLYLGMGMEQESYLSPIPWIFAMALVAGKGLPALWYRRLRVGLAGVAIVLVLYDGALVDYALLCTVAAGLAVSRRGGAEFGWFGRPVISVRETRTLVAVAMTAVFVAPLFTEFNPNASGLFAEGAFFLLPTMSVDQADIVCELNPGSPACTHAMWMLRTGGIGPAVADLMPLVVVAVLARGLTRGRRLAWWGAVATQIVVIAALTREFLDLRLAQFGWFIGGAVLLLLIAPWITILGLLLWRHRYFNVRMAPFHRRRFVLGMFTWLATTAAGWIVLGTVLVDEFRSATRSVVLAATPLRYLPPVVAKYFSADVLPVSDRAWFITEWIGPLFWAGAVFLLYRAVTKTADPQAAERRADAAKILAHGSGDHLAWMTTWEGNRLWFDDEGGYVAYRRYNSVAVTVGEPVVPAGGDPHVVAERFERAIYAAGDQVAWYSVRREFAERRGCQSIPVAEESVLDCSQPPEFRGKKFQDVRTARNRAKKEGIHTVWTTWDAAGPVMRSQIVALSEEWVSDKKLPEMGFTLGGLKELEADEVNLMLAVDADGKLHGVTSWLPVYEDGVRVGLILDFMRRKFDGFRPVVEYLIAETQVYAHELGCQWISLSGAPLVSSTAPATLVEKALARVSSYVEPVYGFQSLAAFKRKFHPDHRKWVLGYRDELSLPAIAVAVTKAYLPHLRGPEMLEVARMLAKTGTNPDK